MASKLQHARSAPSAGSGAMARFGRWFALRFGLTVREGWRWFFFYSAFGWVIDTAFRSYLVRGYSPGSLLPVPLCPVYGIGVLIVFGLHVRLRERGWLAQGMVYGTSLAVLEYLAGEITLFLTGERLWVYHGGTLSMNGFTDLEHVVLWGALSLFLVRWMHPFILRLERAYVASIARERSVLRLR